MAAKTKATRKAISFDESEADQQLLGDIATELGHGRFSSFGELCKTALIRFLRDEQPSQSSSEQSLALLMELQRQVAVLQNRVDVLETQGQAVTLGHLTSLESRLAALNDLVPLSNGHRQPSFRPESHPSDQNGAQKSGDVVDDPVEKDPLLEHLGALLEDF